MAAGINGSGSVMSDGNDELAGSRSLGIWIHIGQEIM